MPLYFGSTPIGKVSTDIKISGSVALPTMTNPASEEEIFEGYETIDARGNKKIGTFTITEEVDTQIDLIDQIKTALNGKTASMQSGVYSRVSYETCNVDVSTNTNFHVTYIGLENNMPVLKWTDPEQTSTNTHSLTNVMCGSYCIVQVMSTIPSYNTLTNAEYIETITGYGTIRYMVFRITANQGETAVISCYDND